MEPFSNYEEVLRRHALPEILFAPDIALVLRIPEDEADARARAGGVGPEFYVGGRVAVLRQDFLDGLAVLGEFGDRASRELLTPRLRVVRPEPDDAS